MIVVNRRILPNRGRLDALLSVGRENRVLLAAALDFVQHLLLLLRIGGAENALLGEEHAHALQIDKAHVEPLDGQPEPKHRRSVLLDLLGALHRIAEDEDVVARRKAQKAPESVEAELL